MPKGERERTGLGAKCLCPNTSVRNAPGSNSRPSYPKANVDLEWTCLFSIGGLEGGESFSGCSLVGEGYMSIEEASKIIADCLYDAVKYSLEDAPRCIMLHVQSSPNSEKEDDNWCDEGNHVGVPTHFTNPDGTPVIHCTICGKQLQSLINQGENMINKERLRAMRLEVLGTTLDGIDFTDEPIEQGVLEGLLFNIGKLLLEHLEEHRSFLSRAIEEVEE